MISNQNLLLKQTKQKMKTNKTHLQSQLKKFLGSFLLGTTLLGCTFFIDEARASDPQCKDVLGTKNSNGKYSKDKDDIKADNTTFCTETPDRFEIVIYELGLCTSPPFTKASKTFNRNTGNCVVTMTSSGSTADIAGSTVSLPKMSGRPQSNSYQHAYVIIKNVIGLKGSLKIDDGFGGVSHYCSDSTGEATNAAASCSPLNHAEELDDFGDVAFSAFYPDDARTSVPMPQGGTVRALLVKNDLSTASQASESQKLVGLFSSDVNNKVVITDATKGLEMELSVTDLGYGIQFDGNGEVDDFGSMPFQPIFKTF